MQEMDFEKLDDRENRKEKEEKALPSPPVWDEENYEWSMVKYGIALGNFICQNYILTKEGDEVSPSIMEVKQ